MLVVNVLRPKSCNHSKGGKHSEMKETSSWEATRNITTVSGRRWEEELEAFQVYFMLVVNDSKF